MTDELNTNAGAGPVEQGVRPGAEAPTLVERLRTDVLWHQRRGNETIARDCQEAADEIERLRATLAAIAKHSTSTLRTNSKDRGDWAEDVAFMGKLARGH